MTGTTITLTAGDYSVEFTGTGVYAGFVYDKLIGWTGVKAEVDLEKRPRGVGSFGPGQTFPESATPSVEGQFFGITRAEALQAREDLTLLYNDGELVTMTVEDDLRTTSREVYVKAVEIPWTIHREFRFTIDTEAPDPKRYGPTVRAETGLPAAGSGLDLGTGLAFPVDLGTVGSIGRITLENIGNARTAPTLTVRDGNMPDGFTIVNVETGERIVYRGPVADGASVTIDAKLGTAFVNERYPAGRWLVDPEWWTVGARSTTTVQFLANGAATGDPRLVAETAAAYY